jgi:hypothetical protein
VKLTTALSVYAGISTAGFTRFISSSKLAVNVSVNTSDTLSMTLLELSFVVIKMLEAMPTCFAGVVALCVNTTAVSWSIACPPISNFILVSKVLMLVLMSLLACFVGVVTLHKADTTSVTASTVLS